MSTNTEIPTEHKVVEEKSGIELHYIQHGTCSTLIRQPLTAQEAIDLGTKLVEKGKEVLNRPNPEDYEIKRAIGLSAGRTILYGNLNYLILAIDVLLNESLVIVRLANDLKFRYNKYDLVMVKK